MISEVIKKRLEQNSIRYFANDNISNYIDSDEMRLLVNEVAEKFEGVLE